MDANCNTRSTERHRSDEENRRARKLKLTDEYAQLDDRLRHVDTVIEAQLRELVDIEDRLVRIKRQRDVAAVKTSPVLPAD